MKPILIEAGSVTCSAGDTEGLWRALCSGERNLSKLPFPPSAWLPYSSAFLVPEPDLESMGINRKLLRTTEGQARLLLAGALGTAAPERLAAYSRDDVGLFLGIPTIEAVLPTWQALETLSSRRSSAMGDVLLATTPPFSGLSLLNSSACAHIAESLGIRGALGAYSQFANAGLDALIEGALSVAEEENRAALVGATSGKVSPLAFVHREYLPGAHLFDGEVLPAVPGEGAAFVLLREDLSCAERAVRLKGYGRAFAASAGEAVAARVHAVRGALAMAGIAGEDLDWVLADESNALGGRTRERDALHAATGLRDAALCVASCEAACGALGPAFPLVQVNLALLGMQRGTRLRTDFNARTTSEERAIVRNVLITGAGCQGQMAAVVLQRSAV